MRIIHLLLLIGILISLTAATASSKNDKSKKSAEKVVASVETEKKEKAAISTTTESSTTARSAKALKQSKPGENRGKRTLYDFGNAGYLYPQVAARRGGYSPDPRTAYATQPGYFNGNGIGQYPTDYNYNYGPYPQYIEAPEPIIEIIIKDANETLPSPQPTVIKTKKKKEKVHVFYVNYKKDENNKLHLESPIASLNNDDTEEEEEEEEVIEYPVTPLPPVKTTTLRTIIHPDSEKYHGNSGIHVTFGTEDKSQRGHILQEHDAESVQRQVVAVPVPQTGVKTQFVGNARQDFPGHARSPYTNSFFQSSANSQYQNTQQQLPNQHASTFFRPPTYQQKPQSQLKSPFGAQTSPQPQHYHHPQQQVQKQHQHQHQPHPQPQSQSQPQQQQPPQNKPLSHIQQHIHHQLQQQSQYYVNHNQLYQQQQQAHANSQNGQYYNTLPQKPTQAPNKQVVFPTAPPKTQDLPNRQAPQPYQPIKFRPTPAPAALPNKPTAIAAKLENSHYNSKPFQFQRQPQFIQQPTFTVQSPTIPPPQYYKQPSQTQYQQHQTVNHAQTSNYQTNSNYYTQNKSQQPQSSQQYQNKYQTHATSGGSSSPDLSWLDIKPSKETQLFKSIPKFEQHITETIPNNYQPSQYQSQNQVIHDIPAPNLAPHQQQNQYINTQGNAYSNYNQQSQSQSQSQSHSHNQAQTQVQSQIHTQGQANPQPQFSNFVTTSTNYVQHQVPSSTPPPQYVESTDGQKIMVVTPMPPNVYQQYQAAHYPTSQGTQQQQSAQVITSIHQSQDQYNQYFQQPRQGSGSVNAQSESSIGASASSNTQFGVSTYHSDVFKELEQRKTQETQQSQNAYIPPKEDTNRVGSTTTPSPKALSQLPAEVPDDLRQQLLSSGILSNADISVLDYDKEGDIALENLPAEHLQHFYGAGGGAQISESKKVLSVVKPNGDKVSLDAKDLERVKETSSVPHAKQTDTKVVRFDGQESESLGSTTSTERQYNRYLPLKINAANFPKPDVEELKSKSLQSVVVLAPVDTPAGSDGTLLEDSKEVKFLGGDLIKVLVKKPTTENFKRWLEKESRTDVELQSVVLLVAKSSDSSTEQEIYMYDIATGEVNRLNGELSSKFVNVAEENASTEDLEHGSTLDPTFLESMMQKIPSS
ncbi:uncharacterized protein LOC142239252 [Haematobia irritans]|uniref:uncharacterized protein LOC142239252 n=1 Tax=Haematobia irritans TaxID=7368 RepID=UPI003F5002DD